MRLKIERANLEARIRQVREFSAYTWKRFTDDRCTRVAASLSYTSLLAIVPLTAIAFAMLAAFPVFEGTREQFQSAIFANFLPQSAEAMREYFDQFVRNAARLTAVGIVGLAVTAVLLLGTVESALNAIFRVARPRALVPRLLVFWALLTLGPLMLGASFSLSTYFFALTEWAGVEAFSGPLGQLTQMVPTLIIMVVLGLFYVVIPNRPVNLHGACIGGAVAGLLFSGLRKVFGIYIAHFPTYQTIYGAVSVVPIFLVWMYLSWTVVLLGAVITAAYGEWKTAGGRIVARSTRSTSQLVMALEILALLFDSSRHGKPVPRAGLVRATGSGAETIERLLTTLRAEGYVERTTGDSWLICRDLASATLDDLYRGLGYGLRSEDVQFGGDGGWHRRLGEIVREAAESQRRFLDVTLDELLRPRPDEGRGGADKRVIGRA